MAKKAQNYCEQCLTLLTKKQRKFCSAKCMGLSYRGTGKSHIRIRIGGKRVYLHRYLFEKHVRPLKYGEVVHHIDENKHNNDLSNLEALEGAAAHLHKHNYWRHRRSAEPVYEYDSDFGW